MVILVHGVAGQVSSVAQGHEMLLLHIVLALRLVALNVGHHKVVMVEGLRQGILGVSQQALPQKLIIKFKLRSKQIK